MHEVTASPHLTGPTVCNDLPRYREIAGHHSPVPFLLTEEMFGGIWLGVEIAGGEISDKVGKAVAEPHTHETAEIYLLLSSERGDAVIDVYVAGQRYELTSPAAMLIPAGAVHHFVTKKAIPGSFCLGILLAERSNRRAGVLLAGRVEPGGYRS